MPKLPLAVLAAALQIFARCGGGDAGAGGAVAQLNTSTYLDGALDAANLFRWTPREDGAPVELHVIVHNGPGELPSGLDAYAIGAAEVETIVRESVTAWVDASGSTFDVQIHADGGTPVPSGDVCSLEVHFDSTQSDVLSGFAWLETRFLDPRVVERVQIRISVPVIPFQADLDTLRALVLHEFGHALGIVAPRPHTGHSPSAFDVMHPEVRWTRLSTEDRRAMQELYRMSPNIVRGDGIGEPNVPDPPDPPQDPGLGPLQPWVTWTVARLRTPWPNPPLRSDDVLATRPGCRDCR